LILGRVVDAGSGRPLPGAIVTLLGAGLASPRAITNGGGQFVFRRLPKGRFTLLASRPGYVDGAYGRGRPGGSTGSVELDDGQHVGDIVITMWRRAAIGGTVTDEAGEPVIGVTVRLLERRYTAGHRRFLPGGTATTDDRGIYRFATLAPGDYIVAFVAHEASLPPDVVELMRTPTSPSDTRRQEIMSEGFRVGMMPGMGSGSPQAMQGGSTVRLIDQSAVPPISDDATAPVFVYPTLYYPNSPSAGRAGVITLESGQERDGIDLSLHPVRASRVSGAVVGPDGPAGNISVHVLPATMDDVTELETAATMTDADGLFTLTGVVSGQYEIKAARIPRPPAPAPGSNMVTTTIQVGGTMAMGMSTFGASGPPPTPPIPDDPALYADTPISLGESNVDNVLVTLQRGASVSGHVDFDGAGNRPDASALSRVPVMVEQADNRSASLPGPAGLPPAPPGRIDGTGAFKTYTQPPGRYLIRIGGAPPGWTLKSVIAEGHDISEMPFDLGVSDLKNVVITFTDRPTKLTGTAHTKDGNPDPGALVVVFPADPAGWTDFGVNPRRLRSARPLLDGTYTITGLPAGDYYVAAISEDAFSSWQNPDTLAEISRSATQVRINDGDTQTQNLVRSGTDR
jgi:protocatechuate 3,4-dioxygenase beta subunit